MSKVKPRWTKLLKMVLVVPDNSDLGYACTQFLCCLSVCARLWTSFLEETKTLLPGIPLPSEEILKSDVPFPFWESVQRLLIVAWSWTNMSASIRNPDKPLVCSSFPLGGFKLYLGPYFVKCWHIHPRMLESVLPDWNPYMPSRNVSLSCSQTGSTYSGN